MGINATICLTFEFVGIHDCLMLLSFLTEIAGNDMQIYARLVILLKYMSRNPPISPRVDIGTLTKNIDIATNMYRLGIAIELIISATNLTRQRIEESIATIYIDYIF